MKAFVALQGFECGDQRVVADGREHNAPAVVLPVELRHGGTQSLLHEHALNVNGSSMTLALDAGSAIPFTDHDRNLKVINQAGEYIYLDCTGFKRGFTGSVPVGVPGRVRRIFRDQLIVQ